MKLTRCSFFAHYYAKGSLMLVDIRGGGGPSGGIYAKNRFGADAKIRRNPKRVLRFSRWMACGFVCADGGARRLTLPFSGARPPSAKVLPSFAADFTVFAAAHCRVFKGSGQGCVIRPVALQWE